MIAPVLLAAVLYGRPAVAVRPTALVTVTYEVKRGDCLWDIAAARLGDPLAWPAIYEANHARIGTDPDLILPGEKIRIILDTRRAPRAAWPVGTTGPGEAGLVHRKRSPGRDGYPLRPGTAPSGGTLSCTGLERLWDAAGGNPRYAFIAAEIAMAESGGNQYAHSPTDDYGYWQINGSHGRLATYDAYGNAQAAISISDNGTDWYPWTTYTSGAYLGRC